MRFLILLLPLMACDFGHLGNPVSLPVHAAVTGIENARYGARRAKVAAYLDRNRDVLGAGDDVSWSGLFETARTPAKHHSKVRREVLAVSARPDWTERATVIVMVHSGA